MRKVFWVAAAVAGLAAMPSPAAAAPCGSGTIAISASSDTPLSGLAYNVGQRAILTAQATVISPLTYSWTIPGPHIKDYQDSLGTQAAGASPLAWSVTPVTAADLQLSSLSLYWQPSAAQTDPNTGPAETRTINKIGLDRNSVSEEVQGVLKQAYKILFREGLTVSNALARIEAELPPSPELRHLVQFVRASERGISK